MISRMITDNIISKDSLSFGLYQSKLFSFFANVILDFQCPNGRFVYLCLMDIIILEKLIKITKFLIEYLYFSSSPDVEPGRPLF